MTYVKDEMLNLAARMTDMSEDLISESDIRSGATPLLKPRRTGRFSAFVNHPAMVAVLCAVVSLGVVVAIVLAGRGEFTAPFWGTQEVNSQENEELITQNEIEDALFSLGMTYEEVIDVLESREISYTYCLQRFFIPKGNGSFLVLMMDPWGPFVIDHIEEYQEKQPATKDIYSIQEGMGVDDIIKLLGRPTGDLSSDPLIMAYKTLEGDEFRIYWSQTNGEFTASRVLQIPSENDVFWIGMTEEQISEVVRQRQMKDLSGTKPVWPQMPYTVLTENDGTAYVLELSTSSNGSVKRVYQYTDKMTTDADIAAINPDESPTLPEIIERLGVPLDFRTTGGQYSGVVGFYINYYFRYITEEGGEYEIVFHARYSQMYGGESSFMFMEIVQVK